MEHGSWSCTRYSYLVYEVYSLLKCNNDVEWKQKHCRRIIQFTAKVLPSSGRCDRKLKSSGVVDCRKKRQSKLSLLEENTVLNNNYTNRWSKDNSWPKWAKHYANILHTLIFHKKEIYPRRPSGN